MNFLNVFKMVANFLILGKARNQNFHYNKVAFYVVIKSSYKVSKMHFGRAPFIHFRIVKMKAVAQTYCYWHNIDSNIEQFVKTCAACATSKIEPLKMNSHPWEWPNRPW